MNAPARSGQFRRQVSGRSGRTLAGLLIVLFLMTESIVDAGLIDRIKTNQRERAERLAREKKAQQPRPRPQMRSYYLDVHEDAYINQRLLEGEVDGNRRIVIDIGRQRAFLIINDLVAIDTAVSTARRGKYTPRGRFSISEKIQSGKVSSIYHVYMPYWMRLGRTAVGMHVGDLPGYPASAGCIRLPQSVGPLIFEHTRRGVPVEVVESWNEEGLLIPYSVRKPTHFVDA